MPCVGEKWKEWIETLFTLTWPFWRLDWIRIKFFEWPLIGWECNVNFDCVALNVFVWWKNMRHHLHSYPSEWKWFKEINSKLWKVHLTPCIHCKMSDRNLQLIMTLIYEQTFYFLYVSAGVEKKKWYNFLKYGWHQMVHILDTDQKEEESCRRNWHGPKYAFSRWRNR